MGESEDLRVGQESGTLRDDRALLIAVRHGLLIVLAALERYMGIRGSKRRVKVQKE